MQREWFSARVNPRCLKLWKEIAKVQGFRSFAGVLESMSKICWPDKLHDLEPGKHERENSKEVEDDIG
jgi:hypothetical protein